MSNDFSAIDAQNEDRDLVQISADEGFVHEAWAREDEQLIDDLFTSLKEGS